MGSVQKPLDCCLERREVFTDRVFDDSLLNPEVLVSDDVATASVIAPGNIGGRILKFRIDVSGGFDNEKAEEHRVAH
jgi:hypothetical protein